MKSDWLVSMQVKGSGEPVIYKVFASSKKEAEVRAQCTAEIDMHTQIVHPKAKKIENAIGYEECFGGRK